MYLHLEYRDDVLTLATAPHAVVVAWTGTPTVEHIATVDRVNRRQMREHPEGAAMFHLLVRGRPAISQEVVEATRRSLATVDAWRTATANVIFLEGFAGVAVRSFLNTINLLARAKRPVRTFEDLDGAVRWMYERLDGHPSRSWREDALLDALRELVDGTGGPTDV